MQKKNFYGILSRMKYINRWGLMRNTREENLSEHTLDVVFITHALTVIGRQRFDRNIDLEKALLIALYHDAGEIFTGDLPTPIKYYSSDIQSAYRKVELAASEKLLGMLPEDFKEEYRPILQPEDCIEKRLVKAADKLSALIKCIEEEKSGNTEFSHAYQTILSSIQALRLPEADVFLSDFLDSYRLTLDELE